MKIVTENFVYVQKNDLGYLNSSDLAIPLSIFIKTFGDGVTVINNRNRYEFVKFEEKTEIEYFKNIDWIIDYNEVKDLNEEELIALGESIALERNKLAKKFNSMSDDEKIVHFDIVRQCEFLNFKLLSVRDIIWMRQGILPVNLPEDINSIKKNIKK